MIYIQVKNENFPRVYLMEDCIDVSFFTKFTSNGHLLSNYKDLSAERKLIIEFSHWSYEWTNQTFMVVDLQGFENDNKYILTELAIQSVGYIFGKHDLGMIGVNRYFMLHKNHCCLNKNSSIIL